MRTEFAFELPRGYVDEHGNLHRKGLMRLATVIDEMESLQDVRVRTNDTYLAVILISKVVLRLGDLKTISTQLFERMYASDFAFLQTLYVQLNDGDRSMEIVETQCPSCGTRFELNLTDPNGTNH